MTEEQKRKFQEKFDGWYPTRITVTGNDFA
jgi:hypothetical protein